LPENFDDEDIDDDIAFDDEVCACACVCVCLCPTPPLTLPRTPLCLTLTPTLTRTPQDEKKYGHFFEGKEGEEEIEDDGDTMFEGGMMLSDMLGDDETAPAPAKKAAKKSKKAEEVQEEEQGESEEYDVEDEGTVLHLSFLEPKRTLSLMSINPHETCPSLSPIPN
jgi:hypothetical protein